MYQDNLKRIQTLFLGTAAAAAITGLSAPTSSAQTATVDAETSPFSAPSGPLDKAIVALAANFGIDVIAPYSLVNGKAAAPIKDAPDLQTALSQVLVGTNLSVSQLASGAYVLQAAPAPAAAVPQKRASPAVDPEEIIIKGTKLGGSLQDQTASIELFTPERLAREQLIDVGDVFLRTPNLNSRGGAAGSISIRGISRGGLAGQGVTSNIYVDGAPLSGNALGTGPTSLWDAAQVEVLRGPQSSVQGRNALAGAVVVTTADPTYDFEGKARVQYSSFETIILSGAVSGPIIADQVAARLSVDYQDTDGFITNTVAFQSADRRESVLLRGKVLIEPSGLPNFTTKFTIDYSDASQGESRPIVSTAFGGNSPLLEDFDFFDYESNGRFPNNDVESIRILNETTYDFTDNWLGRAILTYENTQTDRLFGLEDDISAFNGLTFNQFDAEILSAEVRAEFDYGNLRGLIGGYFYDESDVLDRNIQAEILPAVLNAVPAFVRPLVDINPATSVLSQRDGSTANIQNFAFFAQVEWDISEKWTVNAGFRYDNEEFFQSDVRQTISVDPATCISTVPNALVMQPGLGPFDPVTLPCQILAEAATGGQVPDPDQRDRFDAFLPRLAITYNVTDTNSVFASFSRGYRAGGSFIFAETQGGLLGVVSQVGTYEPEFLTTFEVGSRNTFLDDALTANLNVFYSLYEDQQVVLPGESADTIDNIIANAGESTIYGAELYLAYQASEALDVFASVGYLKTEFDDFPFAINPDGAPANAADPRFTNLAGNEFPSAPNWTFSIGANYTHSSGLFANATFSFISSQFADASNLTNDDFLEAYQAINQANIDAGQPPLLNEAFGATLTEKLDSRTDMTLRGGFQTETWKVYGFVTNLFNSEVLTDVNFGSVNTATGEVLLSPNETFATVNTPRTFGVGAELGF